MNKYMRLIRPSQHDESGDSFVDVYDVLVAFGVTCPARAHAIKKLLCAGLRDKGPELQDLEESVSAVLRAVELLKERESHAARKAIV